MSVKQEVVSVKKEELQVVKEACVMFVVKEGREKRKE